MNDHPLVTVIMCVYNAGGYLREAVQSVLGQTYPNLELLMVDDGSTDGAIEGIADLLADPRVRLIRQANAGKPTAMNRALDEMRGEFYALNDADDNSHSTRIEKQVAAMQADTRLAAVFTGYRLILDGVPVAPLARVKSPDQCGQDVARFVMPSHDPTAMYRKSLVGTMRYDAELPIVEGYDYILRVGELLPMAVIGECLYDYRIHSQSVTKRNPERRNALVREVLRRACQRRGLVFEARFPGEVKDSRPARRAEDLDNNLAAHFMESAAWQRARGDSRGAIRTAMHCARLHPFRARYWKPMVLALLPPAVSRRLRRLG